MRALVVEDDQQLQELLVQVLSSNSFAVDATCSGREAKSLAFVNPYDLILLDVVLPDSNGMQLCEVLREHEVSTPVLMMSVRNSTNYMVEGLDCGADDYLPKPFEIPELMARVRSLMRRKELPCSSRFVVGPIEVDIDKREVKANSQFLSLTNREFMVLECLARADGRVVSKEKLIDKGWDQSYDSFSNIVEVFICLLRKKLLRAGVDPNIIKTVHGVGYKMAPEE